MKHPGPLPRLVILLVLGFLVAPASFLGVVNVGERLLIPAFLILIGWIRFPLRIRCCCA